VKIIIEVVMFTQSCRILVVVDVGGAEWHSGRNCTILLNESCERRKGQGPGSKVSSSSIENSIGERSDCI
jgi:hypothetical protein